MTDNNNKKEIRNTEDPSLKNSRKFDIVALVVCLTIAVFIWFFVLSSNRTIIEETVTVTVNVKDRIEADTGMTIIGEDKNVDYTKYKVTLTLEGTKKAIDTLKEKYAENSYNIGVLTDNIKESGAGYSYIYLTKPDITFSNAKVKTMEPMTTDLVLIDSIVDKDVEISASVGEGALIDGGKAENLLPVNDDGQEIRTVKVQGPSSLVNKIDKVIVKIDLRNYSATNLTAKSKSFEYYSKGILINNTTEISVVPGEVSVKLQIKYENKVVEINPIYTIDAQNFNVSTQPVSIRLSGYSDVLPSELSCNYGALTESDSATVSLLIANGLIVIPNGCTVNEDDLMRVVSITVTPITP